MKVKGRKNLAWDEKKTNYRNKKLEELKVLKRNKSKLRRQRKEARQRGEEVKVQAPNTIESLRAPDETIVINNDNEVAEANEVDEFSDYVNNKITPKLLITTSKKPSDNLLRFIKELYYIIPNIFYYERKMYRAKSIIKYAINKKFTDVIIVTERLKKPCGLYICHLPKGPTSYFKMSNLKCAQDMIGGAATTTHLPEIILNNFTTRLGNRVSRLFMALFPQVPEFTGRRVICFHNQRDFIFFRHHRYIFSDDNTKCRLQEIGPRFTLKLRWLRNGILKDQKGLLEFYWKPDMQVDRKVFFL